MKSLITTSKTDDRRAIYESMKIDIAKKMSVTESGRDYAALSKSLITVIEKINEIDEKERLEREAAENAKNSVKKASPLDNARNKRMKIVANG